MKKTSRSISRDKTRRRRRASEARMLWETAAVVSDIGRRIPRADASERKKLKRDLLRAVDRMHAELEKSWRR